MSTHFEAHVICCNDMVEFVFVGPIEKAREKLEERAKQYYEQTGGGPRWKSERLTPGKLSDDEVYKWYRHRCYWHIHTVKGEEFHDVDV